MAQIDPQLKVALAAIKADPDLSASEKVELWKLMVQQWLQSNMRIVVD